MERATRELTTAGGHKATIYTYMTAGEAQAIASLVPPNPTTAQNMEAQNEGIVNALIDLDGDKENMKERLLALPIQDYREISDAVQELLGDKKK